MYCNIMKFVVRHDNSDEESWSLCRAIEERLRVVGAWSPALQMYDITTVTVALGIQETGEAWQAGEKSKCIDGKGRTRGSGSGKRAADNAAILGDLEWRCSKSDAMLRRSMYVCSRWPRAVRGAGEDSQEEEANAQRACGGRQDR